MFFTVRLNHVQSMSKCFENVCVHMHEWTHCVFRKIQVNLMKKCSLPELEIGKRKKTIK